MENQINFVTSDGKPLFKLPDGEEIIILQFHGEEEIVPCKYINENYVRIGDYVFDIYEFAKIQESLGNIYIPKNENLNIKVDHYEIYQLKDSCEYKYCSYEDSTQYHEIIAADYELKYKGMLSTETMLDDIYTKHNNDNRPFSDSMQSLSVSDLIVEVNMSNKGSFFEVRTVNYVEPIGFKSIDDIFVEQQNILPAHCYSTIPSTGDLIVIKQGERGYYPCEFSAKDPDVNIKLANRLNERLGVSARQEDAMIAGSMFGWNVPAANLSRCDANGNVIKENRSKDYER